jgi:hypothetical protein
VIAGQKGIRVVMEKPRMVTRVFVRDLGTDGKRLHTKQKTINNDKELST